MASLEQQIKQCLSNKETSGSLAWYEEGKKEAAKETVSNGDTSSKAQAMKEQAEIINSFNGDCDAIKAAAQNWADKYSGILNEFVDLADSLSDSEFADYLAKIMSAAGFSETELAATDAKSEEIAAKCGEINIGLASDPCDNKTCNYMNGEICMDGNCVNACSLISCPSGTACTNGLCIPAFIGEKTCTEDASICSSDQECKEGKCVDKTPAAKTCTEDASICGSDQECKEGKCVDKTPAAKTCTEDASICSDNQECKEGKCVDKGQTSTGTCADYPKSAEAYKSSVKNFTTCEKMEQDEEAFMMVAVNEGLVSISDEESEMLEKCEEMWTNELATELGMTEIAELVDKIQACVSAEIDNMCVTMCNMMSDPDAKELCLENCKSQL